MGRNSPVKLTVNVAVIWRLSSIPLIGTVEAPVGLNVYFPELTYDRGVGSKFNTSSLECHGHK